MVFPYIQARTLKMPEDVSYQIQLHFGKDIIHSKEYPMKRKKILSVLKERLQND